VLAEGGDVRAVDGDPAAVRAVDAAEQVQERALAAAAAAQQDQELTGQDVQIDGIEHDQPSLVIRLGEAPHLDEHRAAAIAVGHDYPSFVKRGPNGE